MKKFLPAVLLPALVLPALLLGACSTAKKETNTETTVAAADTTLSADTNSTDSSQVAVSDSTVADSIAVGADSTIDSGSADTTVPTAATDSVPTDSKPATDSVPADTTPTQAVSNVSIQPGQSTDKFVGAAADVTTDVCKADGAGWKASGTVKNSSGAAANYRIYVALNRKGSTDTRALLQVDKSVANGKTVPWEVDVAVSDADLVCIMRVERTAAK